MTSQNIVSIGTDSLLTNVSICNIGLFEYFPPILSDCLMELNISSAGNIRFHLDEIPYKQNGVTTGSPLFPCVYALTVHIRKNSRARTPYSNQATKPESMLCYLKGEIADTIDRLMSEQLKCAVFISSLAALILLWDSRLSSATVYKIRLHPMQEGTTKEAVRVDPRTLCRKAM